jgi:hypothetical protein
MSGADYILAINLTVAGLFAASFAMVAAYASLPSIGQSAPAEAGVY